MCKNCQSEEVEDVDHLLMRGSSVADEREKLVRLMREKVEWQNLEDRGRVTAVLSYACSSGVGSRVCMSTLQKVCDTCCGFSFGHERHASQQYRSVCLTM